MNLEYGVSISHHKWHLCALVAKSSFTHYLKATQVKVNRPVHARYKPVTCPSKHARYMHNDAQQCNRPVRTGPLHGRYMVITCMLRGLLHARFAICCNRHVTTWPLHAYFCVT